MGRDRTPNGQGFTMQELLTEVGWLFEAEAERPGPTWVWTRAAQPAERLP
jgi:hypothetical protein